MGELSPPAGRRGLSGMWIEHRVVSTPKATAQSVIDKTPDATITNVEPL